MPETWMFLISIAGRSAAVYLPIYRYKRATLGFADVESDNWFGWVSKSWPLIGQIGSYPLFNVFLLKTSALCY